MHLYHMPSALQCTAGTMSSLTANLSDLCDAYRLKRFAHSILTEA